ncbi:MAG: hypothetical protein HN564_04370 [Flavobacteriales bacterium]|nr:hypothetical protein [Flavobacteriales bacterium]
MKKIIKQISIILISIVTILGVASLIIASLFSEKIEQSVIQNITNKVKSNIEVGDVTFKIFEDFPYSAVKISNLYIQESSDFGDDTLIFTKKAYIKFSLFEVLSEKMDIDNIKLTDGVISIKYNDNDNNYNVFKKNKEGYIDLNNIELINTQFRYSGTKSNSNIILDCKTINIQTSDDNKMEISGQAIGNKLVVNNKDYISKKDLFLELKIQNKEKKLIITKSIIQVNDLKFILSGSLDSTNYLDLVLDGENQNINSLMKETPKHINHIYSSFLANGTINYRGSIQGVISKEKNPHIDFNYSIKEGVFNVKKYPFHLSDLSCSGTINNGLNNNFNSTEIFFENFKANTKKGGVSGYFSVSNLNNYFLNANFKSNWEMQEANYYFPESPLYECSGAINAQTIYKGNISFDDQFAKHFTEAKHLSKVSLSNIKFLYKNYPIPIKIESSDFEIENNRIQVHNSRINIKDSDLAFDGKLTNILRYIMLEDHIKFDINGNLKSQTLNLKDLIANENQDNSTLESILPEYMTLKINTTIRSLSYNNIYPNNVKGELNYSNKSLTAKKLNMNIFSGKMILDGKFYQNTLDEYKATSSIKLEKVNINQVFSSFNNFGQDFIQNKHIKGICSSNIILNTFWDSKLKFQTKKLDISAKITIEEGELINFKPLESVSNFVKLKDLYHIKFSKLENEIKIKNEVILIPSMEIKSNALSLLISGKHKFNQEYNYKINLLLSELLTKRFQNNTPDFNQKDTLSPVKTNLQLKMSGNRDDMNISFEKLKIKEHIQNKIKTEVINIKKIISEEIDKKGIVEENDDIDIEWDDNL